MTPTTVCKLYGFLDFREDCAVAVPQVHALRCPADKEADRAQL